MLRDTPQFAERADPATLPELMDGVSTYEEFRECLRDLAQVNRVTRGYGPTLAFVARAARSAPAGRALHLVDAGCGGGDTLRAIARWVAHEKLNVRLTGIDINPHAARAAREFAADAQEASLPIAWVTADVFAYAPEEGIDLVLSSLMTHHLGDGDIVRFLAWMEHTARVGWFVNDLYRSRDAFHLFRALAAAARWHRFVRHDGPVSIRRGFREADWLRMIAAAGIAAHDVRLEKHFPSRLCISRLK